MLDTQNITVSSIGKYFAHGLNILLVAIILYVGNTLQGLQTGQQLLNQSMADRHEHYVQRQDQIDKELEDHETRIRGVEGKTARMSDPYEKNRP